MGLFTHTLFDWDTLQPKTAQATAHPSHINPTPFRPRVREKAVGPKALGRELGMSLEAAVGKLCSDPAVTKSERQEADSSRWASSLARSTHTPSSSSIYSVHQTAWSPITNGDNCECVLPRATKPLPQRGQELGQSPHFHAKGRIFAGPVPRAVSGRGDIPMAPTLATRGHAYL